MLVLTLALFFRSNRSVRLNHGLAPYLTLVVTAIGFSSFVAFTATWIHSESGLAEVVSTTPNPSVPDFIAYPAAREKMSPDARRLSDHDEYKWPLPYRTIISANGLFPKRIVFDEFADYKVFCMKVPEFDLIGRSIPKETVTAFRDFSCRHVAAPKPPIMSQGFKEWLKKLL